MNWEDDLKRIAKELGRLHDAAERLLGDESLPAEGTEE